MKHFGILCPPGAGHLNPMTSLGYELQGRGHRVTLFGLRDIESYAIAAKINFYPVGEERFPLGSTQESQQRLGKLNGIPALLYTIIKQVLTQPEYRQNALKLKVEMEQAGGVSKAADIIEAINL